MKNALKFILEQMIPQLPEHKVMEAKAHLATLKDEDATVVSSVAGQRPTDGTLEVHFSTEDHEEFTTGTVTMGPVSFDGTGAHSEQE